MYDGVSPSRSPYPMVSSMLPQGCNIAALRSSKDIHLVCTARTSCDGPAITTPHQEGSVFRYPVIDSGVDTMCKSRVLGVAVLSSSVTRCSMYKPVT